MTIASRTTLRTAAMAVGWAAASAAGQESRPAEAVPSPATQPAKALPADRPLPGPKYMNLRYDDDFTYLDGEPGAYRPDFFDPIKNIRLGDDWRLSLGGEFRFRLEALTNIRFDENARTQDTYQLYRFLLHADLKYRKLARLFVQGMAAFDEDHDLGTRVIDENKCDIHQLFADLRILGEGVPLTLRIGRQELQYGAQRYVSPLDWANSRRRFDAVELFWHDGPWKFDVWYAKPVPVKPTQGDDWDEEFDFYGAYLTWAGIPRHGIDVYFFATDKTGSYRNPNGKVGDENRYTLGSRFWGRTGPGDYEAELAGQWGRWGGDTIQAWSFALDGGHTFEAVPWRPRLGAGFDWASGDEHPKDGKVGTFDQLFPLGHKYLGFLDLIGRQNVTAVNVNLSAWPVKDKVQMAATYHTFWLDEDRDAQYDAGGRALRRDSTGNSGSEVGHELDLTVTWRIDVHSSILLGYSHLWDSDFIINTGKSEDPDFFYVQYQLQF